MSILINFYTKWLFLHCVFIVSSTTIGSPQLQKHELDQQHQQQQQQQQQQQNFPPKKSDNGKETVKVSSPKNHVKSTKPMHSTQSTNTSKVSPHTIQTQQSSPCQGNAPAATLVEIPPPDVPERSPIRIPEHPPTPVQPSSRKSSVAERVIAGLMFLYKKFKNLIDEFVSESMSHWKKQTFCEVMFNTTCLVFMCYAIIQKKGLFSEVNENPPHLVR